MGTRPTTPLVAVDLIIRLPDDRIVLVERRFEPRGWALPGGFVDVGEALEDAAVREAREETGLEVRLERQFHSYSDPSRDARGHTVSVVFLATAEGKPEGGSDAAVARAFDPARPPEPLVFDHARILDDYRRGRY